MAQTHHYLFDTGNQFNDVTGGIDFTNVSGGIASGKINQAFSFFNTGSRSAYAYPNIMPTATESDGSFTLAFWIQTSSSEPAFEVFSVGNMTFYYDSVLGEFSVTCGAGTLTASTGLFTSFSHLVISYDGINGTWTVYVNNTAVSITGVCVPDSTVYDTNSYFYISYGPTYSLAYIDDFRIYNHVIGGAERTRIYSSGAGTQVDASPILMADRVLETSTTTGTYPFISLLGAVSGYSTFQSAVGEGNICFYALDCPTTAEWEVGIGTVYANALIRTSVLSSSNSNSIVNLSAGTKRVYLTCPGNCVVQKNGYIGANNNSPPNFTPGGRLTYVTNTPVESNTSGGSAVTLYYTPYTSDLVYLTTSTGYWRPYAFSQVSLSLIARPADTVYDVFLYDNAGTLTLELSTAFTSRTTRVDAISLRNGVYVKTSNPTRLWLGTISTRATGQGEDSEARRFLWNAYNRVPKHLFYNNTAGLFNFTTAIAPVNTTFSRVEIVCGLSNAESLHLFLSSNIGGSTIGGAGVSVNIGFGVNTTTAFTAQRTIFQQLANSSSQFHGSSSYFFAPSLGYSFISFNQSTNSPSASNSLPNFSSSVGGPSLKGLYWC